MCTSCLSGMVCCVKKQVSWIALRFPSLQSILPSEAFGSRLMLTPRCLVFKTLLSGHQVSPSVTHLLQLMMSKTKLETY